MSEKDGGPAFPRLALKVRLDDGSVVPNDPGMTLRDWFAGKATDEDIADQMSMMQKVETIMESTDGRKQIIYGLPKSARQIARYMHADMMLKERSK